MLYHKAVLASLLALIFLSFFGTLGLSARTLPQNDDWRYRVIWPLGFGNGRVPRQYSYFFVSPPF
jgi:hypothetical protein